MQPCGSGLSLQASSASTRGFGLPAGCPVISVVVLFTNSETGGVAVPIATPNGNPMAPLIKERRDTPSTVHISGLSGRSYLANSTARVSRMTFTLIVPGYCIVDSILVAISRARRIAARSSIFCGFTNTRTSRPAEMA